MNAARARAHATALALAGVLFLAACSGEEPESPPAEDTSAPVATTSAPSPSPTEVSEPADDVNAALDAYIDLELAQKDKVMDMYPGLYTDYTVVAAYPDTVVYTYIYAEAVDPTLAADTLDDVVDMLDSTSKAVVFRAMEQMGVGPEQGATFVYLNPDGSELWRHEVRSDD